MLSTCTEPGCKTFVFGVGACLEHDVRPTREFIRGRPFVRLVAENRVARPVRLLAQPLARALVGSPR